MLLLYAIIFITFLIAATVFIRKKQYMLYFGCLMICFYCAVESSDVRQHFEFEKSNESLLRTVAHLDLSNRPELELVAVDYVDDVAYYRYVNPGYAVSVGDTVYLRDGIKATLVEVSAVGFVIKPEARVTAGMSGTGVLNETGEQIGCISMRLTDDTISCIWS